MSEHLSMYNFFKQEEKQSFIQPQTSEKEIPVELDEYANSNISPYMPSAIQLEEKQLHTYLKNLRSFFRNGLHPQESQNISSFYPALLAPFRDSHQFVSEYPLWISCSDSIKNIPTDHIVIKSLHDLLNESIAQIPQDQKSLPILKDNSFRLEIILKRNIVGEIESIEFDTLLHQSFEDLKTELDLAQNYRDDFNQCLQKLRYKIPSGGLLIPFSEKAPFYIFNKVRWMHTSTHGKNFLKKVPEILSICKDLISIDDEKNPEFKNPDKLSSRLALGGAFINFDKLSAVLPHENVERMKPERYRRIQDAISVLENAKHDLFNNHGPLVLSHAMSEDNKRCWEGTISSDSIISTAKNQTCHTAREICLEHFNNYKKVFKSFRIAELEANNGYVPEIHDNFFDHFDWISFTKEEFLACPPVCILVDSQELLSEELSSFSKLLSSNLPLRFLINRSDSDEAKDVLTDDVVFRQELGSLAIAHRNCFFLQASSISPAYLFKHFSEGFSSNTPSLFHVFSATREKGPGKSNFLKTIASIEGRDFPNFVYQGQIEGAWGSRFHIGNNPFPDKNWPVHHLKFDDKKGQKQSKPLDFTFAHYAALEQRYRRWFKIIDPGIDTDELVALSEYLSLDHTEIPFKIPFIWGIDAENRLRKIAVSWPIVLHCRERLDFWHYLQENGGIHNFHVEKALELQELKYEKELQSIVDNLKLEYQAELEKVRSETVTTTMDNLASFLLDLGSLKEFDQLSTNNEVKQSGLAFEKIKLETQEIPGNQEELKTKIILEEEDQGFGPMELWIETPLCTTCNECTNINNQIFKYNSEQQAYVADPAGGPFIDIVKAAETCPVKIIHPGDPIDKTEANLEDLIKRAAPFN